MHNTTHAVGCDKTTPLMRTLYLQRNREKCKINFLRALAFLLGALTISSVCAGNYVSEQAIESETGYSDVKAVKLEVKKHAPDFTLTSIDGNKVSLSDYRGSGVVLIFYRGYWCPFCISHLEDIKTVLPTLMKIGVQVITVSPDSIANIKSMANRMDNPYVFLSDPDLKVTDRYGIRRNEVLPHPAMVVIDRNGIVQWFYVGENYRKRPGASQLMQVLNRLSLSPQ